MSKQCWNEKPHAAHSWALGDCPGKSADLTERVTALESEVEALWDQLQATKLRLLEHLHPELRTGPA